MEIKEFDKKYLKQTMEVAHSLKHRDYFGIGRRYWFERKAMKMIKKSLLTEQAFVAINKDRVIGFITLKQRMKEGRIEENPDDKGWDITWMGVHYTVRGKVKGVGTALFKQAKKWLKKNGAVAIFVETVAEDAEPEGNPLEKRLQRQAINNYKETNQFYKKMGFKEYEKEDGMITYRLKL